MATAADRLRMVKTNIRTPYAWPGGYPKYFVMQDGNPLSIAAAKSCWREICFSVLHDLRDDWFPAGCEINWEDGELYCAHTGERIESAYAEAE